MAAPALSPTAVHPEPATTDLPDCHPTMVLLTPVATRPAWYPIAVMALDTMAAPALSPTTVHPVPTTTALPACHPTMVLLAPVATRPAW